MRCNKCGGLLVYERLVDHGGSCMEQMEVSAMRCVNCSKYFEPTRTYGIPAACVPPSRRMRLPGSGNRVEG